MSAVRKLDSETATRSVPKNSTARNHIGALTSFGPVRPRREPQMEPACSAAAGSRRSMLSSVPGSQALRLGRAR